MAKRKKKSQSSIELDSILEQFKKTYSSDFEDSLLEAPESEEDEEINLILSKIFASKNTTSSKKTDSASIEEKNEDVVDETEPEAEINELEAKINESEEEEQAEDLIEEAEAHDEDNVEGSDPDAVEDNEFNDNLSAKNEVDSVLSVMLGGGDPSFDNAEETDEAEEINVIAEIVEDSFPDEAQDEELDCADDKECLDEEDELDNEVIEDLEYDTDDDAVKTLDEPEFTVADEEYDVSPEDDDVIEEDVEEDIVEDDIVEEDVIADEAIDEELAKETDDDVVVICPANEDDMDENAEAVSEETEAIPEAEKSEDSSDNTEADSNTSVEKICHLVLSPDEYTYDPLQEGLASFTSTRDAKALKNADANSTVSDRNEESRFDDSDISLLLKLGYDEEIRAEVGENVTEQILIDKDAHFTPEAHKKPFGFCGKEFSDRSQTKGIKEKYRSDKRACLLRLISVCVIAIVILSLYVFFEFFSDRTSYPLVMMLELILVALIGVILYKKLYSGIIGIIKFEANLYSLSVFALFAYFIYDIVILLLYAIKKGDVDTSSLMLFGVTVSTYVILTLISDLLNCIREANTFDIMTSEDRIYTAEYNGESKKGLLNESSANSKSSKSSENAYKIFGTSIISGYFRKTSQSKTGTVNLIYLLGIVPMLSLIIGCISALAGGSIMNGASTVMFTVLLCTPMVYVLIPSAMEFIVSKKLKREDTAFIGTESARQYVKTDEITFRDTDAVEITAFKDIRPSNGNENERYLMIAREVFESLGGTLAKLSENCDDNNESNVILNEITENGIELYFNESINILMGNKQYMYTHKIKVKTDANLNTATRGVDCSVIYMAFDGVPRLGFIINSKIKKEFSDASALLETNGIRLLVESYEPHINDVFFEQNKAENAPSVSVIRPDDYVPIQKRRICDGEIISSRDSLSGARAISFTRRILANRNKNQRMHMMLVVVGLLLSCLLALLINATGSVVVFDWLKSHISLVFNVIMLSGLIPGVINLIKLEKEKFD